MLSRRPLSSVANPTSTLRKTAHLGKLAAAAGLNPKEDAWWSRRLASGSDWMEEWISRPGRK